jgi:hypothetical protein
MANAKVLQECQMSIRYALLHWTALTRYRDDGRLEIDNKIAERALRIVTLGRKNSLLARSDDGADRAAAIYRLLAPRISTTSTRKPACATWSNASPIIPLTGSTSCCLGKSRSAL